MQLYHLSEGELHLDCAFLRSSASHQLTGDIDVSKNPKRQKRFVVRKKVIGDKLILVIRVDENSD